MKLNIVKEENRELSEYVTARKASDEAKARLELATEALTNRMTREQRKSYTMTDGGKRYKVTFVQQMRTKIDEPGLKKALGAINFRKVCKQVVDRKKLEEAMETGTADPMVVGQFIKEEATNPFLRFTEGLATDESSPSQDESA